MFDPRMKMKEKVVEEIMNMLDQQEGEKIKPKAAEVSITAIKPVKKEEMSMDEESPMHEASESPEDEEKEEMLKQLLASYMGK